MFIATIKLLALVIIQRFDVGGHWSTNMFFYVYLSVAILEAEFSSQSQNIQILADVSF